MHSFPLIALFGYLAALAVSDTLTHRIPNTLTVAASAVAMSLSFASHGVSGALVSSAGLLLGLSVFLPFYLLGGFGAGDVKGMAAAGAFLGPYGVILAACWTLIVGLVAGLAVLIATGGWSAVRSLANRWAWRVSVLCATGHSAHVEADPGDPARRRFPYGFAIACGTAASLVWRS